MFNNSNPIGYVSILVAGFAVVACLALVAHAQFQMGAATPSEFIAPSLWLVWPYGLCGLAAYAFRNSRGGWVYFLGMAILCGLSLWALHAMLAVQIQFDLAVKGGMKCAIPGHLFVLMFLPLGQAGGLGIVVLLASLAGIPVTGPRPSEGIASHLLTDIPDDTFQSTPASPDSIQPQGVHHVQPPPN